MRLRVHRQLDSCRRYWLGARQPCENVNGLIDIPAPSEAALRRTRNTPLNLHQAGRRELRNVASRFAANTVTAVSSMTAEMGRHFQAECPNP